MSKLVIKLSDSLVVKLSKPTKKELIDIFSLQNLPKLLQKLSAILWQLYFLFFFLLGFFNSTDPGKAMIQGFYMFVILQLGIYLLKKLLVGGEFFKPVKNDIAFLLFTSLIGLSLLIAVSSSEIQFSLFGGRHLRILSGFIIIAVWFYHYLLVSEHTSDLANKLIKNLAVSQLLAAVINLFMQQNFDNGFTEFAILLLPFWLWLSLKEKKSRFLYLFNLILSFAALTGYRENATINLSLFSVFFLMLTTLVAKYRKDIKGLFGQLDKSTDQLIAKKINFASYLQQNAHTILLIICGLFSIIGILWLTQDQAQNAFLIANSGRQQISQNLTVKSFFLGSGLINSEGSYASIFFLSFGAISTVALIYLLASFIWPLLKKLKTDLTDDHKFTYLIIVYLVIIYMLLGRVNEQLYILFWTVLSCSVLSSKAIEVQKIYKIKGNYQPVLTIMRNVALFFVAILTLYFMAQIVELEYLFA